MDGYPSLYTVIAMWLCMVIMQFVVIHSYVFMHDYNVVKAAWLCMVIYCYNMCLRQGKMPQFCICLPKHKTNSSTA